MKQKATIALFIVTIIWGCTFLWLKRALDSADSVSTTQTNVVATLFVTLRFGLTLPIFLYFTPSIRKNLGNYRSWYDGAILAFFMLGGFVFQMWVLCFQAGKTTGFLYFSFFTHAFFEFKLCAGTNI